MSHSTTAAVRQNEMKVNITLPTTITCAARARRRLDGPAGSPGVDMFACLGRYVPKGRALRQCRDGRTLLTGPGAGPPPPRENLPRCPDPSHGVCDVCQSSIRKDPV